MFATIGPSIGIPACLREPYLAPKSSLPPLIPLLFSLSPLYNIIHSYAAKMSTKTISRPNGNDDKALEHPIITGFTPVASYNWLDDPDPTVLVPGT